MKDQVHKYMRMMELVEGNAGDREEWSQAVGKAKYQLGTSGHGNN